MADPTPAEAMAAAAQGGKKAGKKAKAQKVPLDAFLADAGGTSWADEMEALPTGPSMREDGDSRPGRGFGGGGGGDFRRDSSRYDRPEAELPTSPPFTAFVGNLSFDASEGELEDFFGAQAQVSTVRIVRDHEGRAKGFGYVEFVNLEGLKAALAANGAHLSNRSIRVTVAEPQKREPAGGFGDRGGRSGFSDQGGEIGRSGGAWVRQGPLPPLERGPSSSGTNRSNYPDREREFGGPPDTDRWGSARGAKFVPSANEERRSTSGGFGGRYVPSPAGGSSGTNTPPTPRMGSDDGSGGPSRGEMASSWRRSSQTGISREGSFAGERSPPTSNAPSPSLVRKKLDLAPRTATAASSVATPDTHSSNKPSPFGNAAPVDTAERERLIQAKIEKDREEKEEKARVEREERERARTNRADPFGAAKPIDTAAKEKEIEEKVAMRRAEEAAAAQLKSSPNGHAPASKQGTPKQHVEQTVKAKEPGVQPPKAAKAVVQPGISYSRVATSKFSSLAIEGEDSTNGKAGDSTAFAAVEASA